MRTEDWQPQVLTRCVIQVPHQALTGCSTLSHVCVTLLPARAFIVPTSLASRPVAGLTFGERTEGSMVAMACKEEAVMTPLT